MNELSDMIHLIFFHERKTSPGMSSGVLDLTKSHTHIHRHWQGNVWLTVTNDKVEKMWKVVRLMVNLARWRT